MKRTGSGRTGCTECSPSGFGMDNRSVVDELSNAGPYWAARGHIVGFRTEKRSIRLPNQWQPYASNAAKHPSCSDSLSCGCVRTTLLLIQPRNLVTAQSLHLWVMLLFSLLHHEVNGEQEVSLKRHQPVGHCRCSCHVYRHLLLSTVHACEIVQLQ